MNKSIVWLILLLIAACGKDSGTAKDIEVPVITISSPTQGQSFTAGQSINIAGSISDNNYIAEVHIHVSNNNTGTLLMDVHLYPGANTTTFSQSIAAVAGVNYKILVTAKDKSVNEGRNSIEVTCN